MKNSNIMLVRSGKVLSESELLNLRGGGGTGVRLGCYKYGSAGGWCNTFLGYVNVVGESCSMSFVERQEYCIMNGYTETGCVDCTTN